MSGFQSTSLCRVPAGAKRPGLRGAGGGQRPAGDPPHFSEVGCRVAHKQVGAQASPTLLDGALAPLYPHLLIHPCPLLCVGSKFRISFFKNKSEYLVSTHCVPGTKCIISRTFHMVFHHRNSYDFILFK